MASNSNIKLFSGTSHPELAQLIAQRLGLPLGKSSVGVLPSGELSYGSTSLLIQKN
jgi:ribose-phosphate pyrophosphokinase